MKKIYILLSFLTFCCKIGISQYTIEGTVFNQNKEKLDYFHAIICNVNDTSFIEAGTFINGDFKLEINSKIKCLLKISFLGLQSKFETIDFNQNPFYKFDSIILYAQAYGLSEVNISAKMPKFLSTNGNITLIVKSTALSEAGNAIDVLKRTPGLILDNMNNIRIFGRGAPQIFIDNREVTSNSDLQMLQSNEIVKIEIIKNASAEYSASANAIIKITTKKIKNDILNAEIYNRSYFGRKFSNNSGIRINSKKGKINSFINYQYQNVRSENYYNDFDKNYQENYTIINNTVRKNTDLQNNHYLLIGSNYEIDSTKNIGIQYRYNIQKYNLESYASQVINISNKPYSIIRSIQDVSKDRSETHHLTTSYNQSLGKNKTYIVIIDYSEINHSDNTDLKEINQSMTTHSTIENNSNNQIFAIKGDFNLKLHQNINLKTGIKMSYTKSKGSVKYGEYINNVEVEKDNINDFIGAWFCLLSKSFRKVNIEAGLRNEITDAWISENNLNILDSTYSIFFPSFNVNYTLNDKFGVMLNYTKKIKRPSFSQINPNYIYIDSLAYMTGNPLLKPIISHNTMLSISLSNSLLFSAEFSHRLNEIAFAAFNDDNNPDILRYTNININNSKHFILDISYVYSLKKFTFYSSAGIDFPHLDIPYLGSIRKIRNPIYYFSLNNNYSLSERFSVYLNYLYQSSGEDQMTYYNSSGNLSAGFLIKFFDKKFVLNCDVNDILKTSDITWTDRYGTIENGQIPDLDSRYLKITVKYYFNDFKNVFKGKSGISDEINRIEK